MKKKDELCLIQEAIETGNYEKVKAAIKAHAFHPGTQVVLLNPEYETILGLYLAIRKPCREFVGELLKGQKRPDWVVYASIVGNSLSEENEVLLVENYPQYVVAYTEENPQGPYLGDDAYERAKRVPALAGKVKKMPAPAAATTSLGGMFSPEMLAKLGL